MQMERYFQYGDGEFSCSYTYTQTSDLQNFSMHTHENHELYYFLSGRGVYRIESSEYPMRPGDILIMRRAESHY
jgi:mannose-6-phosphate isomerase-like protein (cupin superfamily)